MAYSPPAEQLERLARAVRLDRETGLLHWRILTPSRPKHGIVGCVAKDGYRAFTFEGRTWKAHVVVWFLEYGEWAPGKPDHKNRLRGDNRPSNLRAATPSQQHANVGLMRNSTTGAKGVTYTRSGWWARLMVEGRRISLGYFKTKEDAAAAYLRAAQEHFGEFANG